MAPEIDNPRRNKRHYDEWIAGPRHYMRHHCIMQLMKGTEPGRSLEIGFGAGKFLLELARMGFEAWGVFAAEIQRLSVANNSYDLVLCNQVLEHLERPEMAILELRRVCTGACLISVPHEPFFRLGNFLRGRHVLRLGNHPGHRQAWNPGSLCRLLAPNFAQVRIELAFPWILALCYL